MMNNGSSAWCSLIALWLRPKIERATENGEREIALSVRDLGKILRGLEYIASKGEKR
jgi:hypothetical protein